LSVKTARSWRGILASTHLAREAVIIGRRELLAALGGAACAWPFAARAQQPGRPIIGFLGSSSSGADNTFIEHLRRGLGDAGFVEGCRQSRNRDNSNRLLYRRRSGQAK
jgi:hypothetical protein